MTLIDFHTHVYPQKIAEKATQATCSFYDLHTQLVGTTEVLLQKGKQAGISQFVILPVAVKAEQARHINEFTVSEVAAHPEFYGFGTLHAAMENPLEEVDWIIQAGLKGVKMHPDIQNFPIDDPRLFPVYDRMQGVLPVLLHTGDPRHDNSHPRRMRKVMDMFPRLQVIAAHLGGWSVFDTAIEYLKDTSCFVDLCSCFQFLTPEKMCEYIRLYGAERVLFGTDFPLWEPQEEVKAFERLPLRDDERELIAYRNALRILES